VCGGIQNGSGDEKVSPILSIRNLHVRRQESGVCFDLFVQRLQIFAGEVVEFVGESGCGKSTLMDMLGLAARPDASDEFTVLADTPDAVDVMKAGESALASLRRRHFGYMLQAGGLLPFLSVFENVALPLRINGRNRSEAGQLLEAVGVSSQAVKKPAYLSGGQRQRVALARALVHGPAIILADEPTGAVDKLTAREIRDLLLNCARSRGAAVLIVTHDEALVHGKTDRVFGFEVTRTSATTTESRLREESWSSRSTSFSAA
jgi:putative ABC transport system ATP-binding protein